MRELVSGNFRNASAPRARLSRWGQGKYERSKRMNEEELIAEFPELRYEPADKVFKILEEMEDQENDT